MIQSFDIIAISHLRWEFVYQRPQHLLARAARRNRVLFVEEPVRAEIAQPELVTRQITDNLTVAVPHLPHTMSATDSVEAQRVLLARAVSSHELRRYVLWFYTPMGLDISGDLAPIAVVYDCMDELSGFHGAPLGLANRERALFQRADVVFTGGHSLYLAKRHLHPNVWEFPSAVDFEHFSSARSAVIEPEDQRSLPHPRAGFFGVIDERMDLALIDALSIARPELQIVMIGPVAKIDPGTLPRRANIHWLGTRPYAALPSYAAFWDVALLPFALNSATRFISPTKTPEYLAAGLPVVSTPIRDVVHPYGEQGLVRIAEDAEGFSAAITKALREPSSSRLIAGDRLIKGMSWDRTWSAMEGLIAEAIERRKVERPVVLLISNDRATVRAKQRKQERKEHQPPMGG